MTPSSLTAPLPRQSSENDHIVAEAAAPPPSTRALGGPRPKSQEARIFARSWASAFACSCPTWMAAMRPEAVTKTATGSPGTP